MPRLAPRAMPLVWNLMPLLLLLAWSGLNGSPFPTILPCASAFVTPTPYSTTCTATSLALATRIGNTPAQDGGATPTAAEQQEIDDCKAAVYVPSNFLGDGTRQLYWWFLYNNREADGVLFRVLKLIRDGTPVSYIDIDPDIYWSDEVKKVCKGRGQTPFSQKGYHRALWWQGCGASRSNRRSQWDFTGQ